MQSLNLEEVLEKAEQEVPLTNEELGFLLGMRDVSQLEKVFATARELRRRYFDNQVFLYGFIYFSTYCRNNCNFCFYRKANSQLARYRKEEGEILSAARVLAESGVHLLDLTMGEDPAILPGPQNSWLFEMTGKVKQATGLPLMISPGVVSEEDLHRFKQAGADWYACYQETHNKVLYSQLRLNQSYEERMAAKTAARGLGLLIEEGLLTGVGDTGGDLIQSIRIMGALKADQVRVMSFVPQAGTPMAGRQPVSRLRELAVIAVLRLVFPDRLIPASLDVDGLAGLRRRLQAGANVVTSIIPPKAGLAGVSRSLLDIEEGQRSAGAVVPVLTNLGLRAAGLSAYKAWIAARKQSGTPARERVPACG